MTALRVLRPAGADHLSDAALLDLYDGPPAVIASMITTVDGGATGADGLTGSINGPADLRVFTALRTLADVVLVGAGTVRAEGYGPLRLPAARVAARRDRGLADQPTLAVVSASGDVPDAVLAGAPWVFTSPGSAHLARLRAALPPDRLVPTTELAEVVAALRSAGARRIVTEGGPHLLGDLLAAGLVDELCLTTAPVLVGGPAPRIVTTGWLSPAPDLELVHVLEADGVLLARWRVRR